MLKQRPHQTRNYSKDNQSSRSKGKDKPKPEEFSVSKDQSTFQQNIQIFLRVKPSPKSQPHSVIKILNQKEVEIFPPNFASDTDKVFKYQEVFPPSATNLQVFKKTMTSPIKNVLQGFNSTIFIYGMTGAGKTYTMLNSSEKEQHSGLVDLTLSQLFSQISTVKNSTYQILLSFYEIYNQNIRDLLVQGKQNLTIQQDPAQGVVISDLKQVSIENPQKARAYIQEGMTRRVKQATMHNETSSRSHGLLQFTVRKITSQGKDEMNIQQSKLFMIDLAGNEKATQNENKRFQQGVNINKSLLTLGKCISILAQNKKAAFIPYRDSKLTRILKQALGGNSKTVMVACISSSPNYYEQTLNTLKYSSKAKQIKNKAKICSVKKVKKDKEVQLASVNTFEGNVIQFARKLQKLQREKIKSEQISFELQTCLQQYRQIQKYDKNMNNTKKIQELTSIHSKVKQKGKHIQQKIQEQINYFVQISSQFHSNPHPKELSNISQIESIVTEPMKSNYESSANKLPICYSQQQLPSPTQSLPPQPISIRLASCKNSNKQNILHRFNKTPTNSSITSLHSSFQDKQSATRKSQISLARPLNDITKQNFKLQSPTTRDHIFIQSDSNQKGTYSQGQEKDIFANLLKQMDKNPYLYQVQQIKCLLLQFLKKNYEINPTEKSMISKLKFVLKNMEKDNLCTIGPSKKKKQRKV